MKKKPLDLRPTQFVLGIKEVEDKIKKMTGLKTSKLQDYVDSHIVPCVIGPGKEFYIVDHHHFVSAAWHFGLETVKVEVLEDQSDLSQEDFWKFMRSKKWLYLYDQFGKGPHDPSQLPYDIRGLSDDIYRSLAWELRNAGVIAKVQRPFSEFKWVQYLRAHLKVDLHTDNYAEAVVQAIELVNKKLAKEASPQ